MQKVTTVRSAQRPSMSTGRLTVVVVIAAMLLLTLALPLREFLSQRAQIARLEAKTAEQRVRVDLLQKQAEQWRSDEYAKAQARERLHYAYPGETTYVVVDPPAQEQQAPVPEEEYTDNRAWYEKALGQVEQAQRDAEAPVVDVDPNAPR